MKHCSHNKFHRSMACKSLMVKLGKSGLRPCQVRKAVNAMKSPNEPTITWKQCADILAEEQKQYKVVKTRRAAEEDEDFKTMNSKPVFSFVHPIEAKAVRDPAVLTILKGRPRNATRVKPPIEVKHKKTVTCSYCKESGHNIIGCQKKKAASMQEKNNAYVVVFPYGFYALIEVVKLLVLLDLIVYACLEYEKRFLGFGREMGAE
nr:protein FAR1-related sequence 5-like [Tanacetum cinerariifolium]